MELKGTKTEANLQTAFAGESMATNKYAYFASKAKKEGYVQISNIFTETSGNEREHAKLWFKYLNGGAVPDTASNLLAAAEGENEEWTSMERYRTILKNLEEGMTFKRDGVKIWKCLNCGYIHYGDEAPEKCPLCAHPKAYFEERTTNY